MNISTCVGCGCTDECACENGCWWLRVDRTQRLGVCSECEQHVAAWDKGERSKVFEQQALSGWAVSETSHSPATPLTCDAGCGAVSTRWFGWTAVRICDKEACCDHIQNS